MTERTDFDAIIVGGSYAGLSAAMALGRALKNVLVLDSGKPCNQQTPHSHNFLTQDGETPAAIASKAKEQVLSYPTVTLRADQAVQASGQNGAFKVATASGNTFTGSKLLFATGIKDIMPEIPGFAACWGITILHCPYCHGYEVHHQELGILANGDMAFELVKLIQNWSPKITVLTNGQPTFTPEQLQAFQKHQITIDEREIAALQHEQGHLQHVVFTDASTLPLKAIFARPAFLQHSSLPQELGCAITETGHIAVDDFQKTTVSGIFAAGDATTGFRTVSMAVAAGTKAAVVLSKELIDERF